MFKMFGRDPIVLDMEMMFEPKQQYLGDLNAFIDLEALCAVHMQRAARLKQTMQKEEKNYPTKTVLPKVRDTVLFHNHQKTGFASSFLPGCRVVKKIDYSNYLIKHAITGRTSQVHIKDLNVSPMIRQVLHNLQPLETFGRYANCPQMTLRDLKCDFKMRGDITHNGNDI